MSPRRPFFALAIAATVPLFVFAAPALAEIPAVSTDRLQLGIGGRLQLMGEGELLNEVTDARDPLRAYLFQKQARLRISAKNGELSMFTQLQLGGDALVAAPTPGMSLALLDMFASYPVGPLGTLQVGQFKVPFGREQLTDTGDLAFNGRSIAYLGLSTGRDVGATLDGQAGPAQLNVGVFTGGGRDLPQEYLPEAIGVPLIAARATFGDPDATPYFLSQHAADPASTSQAVSIDALFTRDSVVGHASVLNVKEGDRSLLIDPNWNPYLGKVPTSQGDLWQAGADWALRTPVPVGVLATEAELDYGGYANGYGAVHLATGRVQAGVTRGPLEVALRYAALLPDPAMGATNATTHAIVPITGGQAISELTPAVTWFLNGENLKVTLDAPILFNVPVFNEPGVGSYTATEMPAESSVLNKGGTATPQTVLQARLGLQAAF